jgi:adenylate kinase
MRIILLGAPGSGKGTQGDLIEKKYGFPRISTGDLLRNAVQQRTPLGKKASAQMNRGELVSDEIVAELVREKIFSPGCLQGYVLDGFPRNLTQAQILEKMDGRRPEITIEIYVDAKTLMERLGSRRVCSRCGAIFNLKTLNVKDEDLCQVCGGQLVQRQDDNSQVIKERLRVYREQAEPLRNYYLEKKVYHRVDGTGAVESIFHEISSILDHELGKERGREARR